MYIRIPRIIRCIYRIWLSAKDGSITGFLELVWSKDYQNLITLETREKRIFVCLRFSKIFNSYVIQH